MARRRMIDPGIWSDPTIGELSIAARLLFIGMLSLADDEGRIDLNIRYLRKEIFGYDDMTIADVTALLDEIRLTCKNVQVYEVDDRQYAVFLTWSMYQKIDRPYRSRLPDPPDYVPDKQLAEWSTNKHRAKANDREPFDEHSTNIRRTFPPKEKEKEKEKVNTAAIARARNVTPPAPKQNAAAAELLRIGFTQTQTVTAIRTIPDLGLEDVEAWKASLPTSDKDNPIAFMAWALAEGMRRPDPPLKKTSTRQNGHTNGLAPPPPDVSPDERQRMWAAYNAEMDAIEGPSP